MVCNKCYETTKNDNLLYGLRLTEINFINEEISFYHRLDDKQPVHTQEILSVYYALARLYIKKNDSAGYSRIKNKIIALSPQDRFFNNNHI